MEEETRKFIEIMAKYGAMQGNVDFVKAMAKAKAQGNVDALHLDISSEDVIFVHQYFTKIIRENFRGILAESAQWR